MRGGWTSHSKFLSLDGNPCRLINACGVCCSDDGELKGVIGIHVDDFLIGLADGEIGEKWMSDIKSLYRWGSWKLQNLNLLESEGDNSRDFSITADLEDHTNKFITEAPITRERSRQRQESLTA